MESYRFQNLNFTYPQGSSPALQGLSFTIQKGEFVILCGASGCGKSTLLRHFKTCLTPHGQRSGEIFLENRPLESVRAQEQAQKVGFVLQSPENQVVTDQVWHELAFGLESLGLDSATIRRRVAEIAAFFGIEGWFHRDVSQLSGGQKQLLSLASVMVMQPSVVVLDEPTSQLDPIAATDFLALLGRIHRELGTTIVLCEHRLEEAFPYATRVMVMEEGSLVCDGSPQEVGLQLKNRGSGMFLAMPTAMRLWAALDTPFSCPLTVPQGSEFLTAYESHHPLLPLAPEKLPEESSEVVLTAKELWFRYEKDSPDILKGLDLQLHKGEFYALLGGNGSGKTTALRLLAGLKKAYRGSVACTKPIAHLPQNPQSLFVKKSVRQELLDVSQDPAQVAHVADLCRLGTLLDRHPYDLSGGEQQRTALAKVLLTQPEILLLDEPTKGFDPEFKQVFAGILRKLTAQGVTILMVSHDVTFCAEHAHKCGLFFDGSVVAEGSPRAFFSGNSFYTTSANRLARHLQPHAVTLGDVLQICGAQTPPPPPSESDPPPLPPQPKPESAKLPLWRRLLQGFSGLAAVAIFLYASSRNDLSQFLTTGGITPAAKGQLWLYGALILCLAVFLVTSSPPAPKPLCRKKYPKGSLAAAFVILLCIPVTIYAGVVWLEGKYYNAVALGVLILCILPFFLMFEGRKPQARELVTVAVLCAIGVAGRGAFFMLPQFKPVLALTVLVGVSFGCETGFLVGAVTMLVSNMLFSQGPWTAWQMFAMGFVGFLSGLCFRRRRPGRIVLAVFGAFCAIAVYGGIMNFSSALTWNARNLTWGTVLAYYITGLPMDLIHGAATAAFLLLISQPMLEKLERIQAKYAMTQ